MNKRTFLRTLGLFTILPGAGRVWKAVRVPPQRPPQLVAYWHQTRRVQHYVTQEYLDAFRELCLECTGIPEDVVCSFRNETLDPV